jgi:hypothetical protein
MHEKGVIELRLALDYRVPLEVTEAITNDRVFSNEKIDREFAMNVEIAEDHFIAHRKDGYKGYQVNVAGDFTTQVSAAGDGKTKTNATAN